jgi:hypothetical protein
MINKHIIVKLLGIVVLFAIGTGLLLFKSADFAHNSIQKELLKSGFAMMNFPEPEKRIGALRYKNIAFGTDEHETTIDTLTLTYSPLQWKQLTSIKINGVYLSGEIDMNANLSLHGMPKLSKISSHIQNSIKTISIKDLNFSVLSAHFGGIRGIINLSAQRDQNALIWSGNIDSRQDQLEIIAKINAQTNNSGTWVTDFEIENAKLERNFGKLTRLNGIINATGQHNEWKNLKAELTAGGFIAHKTTWQNASLTIEASPNSNQFFIAAKSSGTDGLELNIEGILGLRDIRWKGYIHAETGRQLIDYLNTHKIQPFNQDDLEKILAQKNTNTHIFPKGSSIIFNIKNTPEDINIKGIMN